MPGSRTSTGPYDVICSRAFASLADFVTWSSAAPGEQGVWMAMKGKQPDGRDRRLCRQKSKCFTWNNLQVPGLDAERCIVWMRKRDCCGNVNSA